MPKLPNWKKVQLAKGKEGLIKRKAVNPNAEFGSILITRDLRVGNGLSYILRS